MTREAKDDWARCKTCDKLVSKKCPYCGGNPEPDVTMDQLARGAAQVDRATGAGEE